MSTVEEESRRHALRAALVDRRHVLLYQQDPVFRYGIDMLTGMLVHMVDGLAAGARKEAAERARLMEAMKQQLPAVQPIESIGDRDGHPWPS